MYCGIYSNMASINAEGKLINCQMEPMALYSKPTTEDLHILLSNETCLNCDFFILCRSGCIKRIQYTKNKEALDITCYWLKLSHILSLFSLYYTYDSFKKDFIKKFEKDTLQNFIF